MRLFSVLPAPAAAQWSHLTMITLSVPPVPTAAQWSHLHHAQRHSSAHLWRILIHSGTATLTQGTYSYTLLSESRHHQTQQHSDHICTHCSLAALTCGANLCTLFSEPPPLTSSQKHTSSSQCAYSIAAESSPGVSHNQELTGAVQILPGARTRAPSFQNRPPLSAQGERARAAP